MKYIHVRVTGTGINDEFDALDHEIVGLAAGTYHKFTLINHIVYYLNDFGVRSVSIERRDQAPQKERGTPS